MPNSVVASSENRGRSSRRQFRSLLNATSEGSDGKDEKQLKTAGVYVRPSGAIERGSGFFVPGLEGPRVRLVFGTVLLVLTAVNHFLGNNNSMMGMGNTGAIVPVQESSFEEVLAVVYSLLILFQAAIEYAKEIRQAEAPLSGGGAGARGPSREKSTMYTASDVVFDQHWDGVPSATDVDASYRSNVQWAAASYLAMTPATQMLLLTSDVEASSPSSSPGARVLYRLGAVEFTGGSDASLDDSHGEKGGVQAALQELRKSKGGRIALPLTHPAVKALGRRCASTALTTITPEKEGYSPRTIILQRITDNSCWLVASNQLLASFTPGDLKWLGQLAKYVAKNTNS